MCQIDCSFCSLSVYFSAHGKGTLGARQMSFGIVDGSSSEDFHFFTWTFLNQPIVLGVVATKGQESGIMQAVIQSSVTATNIAMHLLSAGFAPGQFFVPVVSTTGLLMHFGATVVLDHNFPIFIPISKTLDLMDSHENKVAAAFVQRINLYCRELESKLCDMHQRQRHPPQAVDSGDVMSLNPDMFFVKRYDQAVFERGIGMFSRTSNLADVQVGLLHMIKCYNAMYAVPELRDSIAFPLSFCTPDDQDPNSRYSLVFENLTRSDLGYRIGCPDRIKHPNLFSMFKLELNRVVELMHSAGVIHCDLYFSNIMWRMVTIDGSRCIQIKLIDFDGSHRLSEGKYAEKVQIALDHFFSHHFSAGAAVFGTQHDMMYISIMDLPVTAANREYWRQLASADKSTIDRAFLLLLRESVHCEAGDD
jgi:hypothetical protein